MADAGGGWLGGDQVRHNVWTVAWMGCHQRESIVDMRRSVGHRGTRGASMCVERYGGRIQLNWLFCATNTEGAVFA